MKSLMILLIASMFSCIYGSLGDLNIRILYVGAPDTFTYPTPISPPGSSRTAYALGVGLKYKMVVITKAKDTTNNYYYIVDVSTTCLRGPRTDICYSGCYIYGIDSTRYLGKGYKLHYLTMGVATYATYVNFVDTSIIHEGYDRGHGYTAYITAETPMNRLPSGYLLDSVSCRILNGQSIGPVYGDKECIFKDSLGYKPPLITSNEATVNPSGTKFINNPFDGVFSMDGRRVSDGDISFLPKGVYVVSKKMRQPYKIVVVR